MNFPRLKNLLDKIIYDDQHYRHSVCLRSLTSEKQVNKIWNIIRKKNKRNQRKIECILKRYHNLDVFDNDIEYLLYDAFFLVIQHSNIDYQEKYLPLMKKAVQEQKLEPSSLALLEDRILVEKSLPQIYGSQVIKDNNTGTWVCATIEDEVNVNKRRQEVGLEPLEIYLLYWGIDYKPVTR